MTRPLILSLPKDPTCPDCKRRLPSRPPKDCPGCKAPLDCERRKARAEAAAASGLGLRHLTRHVLLFDEMPRRGEAP